MNVEFCQGVRDRDWVVTKIVGMTGAGLLLVATPLIACQNTGCAGGRQARLAWLAYAAAAAVTLLCAVLGLAFKVNVPMAAPTGIGLVFALSFGLMAAARCYKPGAAVRTDGGGSCWCDGGIPLVSAVEVTGTVVTPIGAGIGAAGDAAARRTM